MESRILQDTVSFLDLISTLLVAQDEEFLQSAGGLRPGGKIDLNEYTHTNYTLSFRRAEIHQLVIALDLPLYIRCEATRIFEDRETALCMLLRRLTYPSRLVDIEMQFGWERTRFSRITHITALFLWTRWKHLLRFNPQRLSREKLAHFGRVFSEKGAPLDVVVGIIDGTLQKNARPVRNQRIVFNGWKHMHCLKYHAVLSPDGLVIHVYGPVNGRRHDETVFKQSGLSDLLDKHFWSPDGQPLYLYGDLGYSVGPHILCPYKGPVLTFEQKKFNYRMSRVREPVEWIFKEVNQQFEFLDFSRSQKILLTPCALFYMVALLMCNAHTILHVPQIPQYFSCQPPSLEEYFVGGPIDDAELDQWCMDSPWEEVQVEEELEIDN